MKTSVTPIKSVELPTSDGDMICLQDALYRYSCGNQERYFRFIKLHLGKLLAQRGQCGIPSLSIIEELICNARKAFNIPQNSFHPYTFSVKDNINPIPTKIKTRTYIVPIREVSFYLPDGDELVLQDAVYVYSHGKRERMFRFIRRKDGKLLAQRGQCGIPNLDMAEFLVGVMGLKN